MRLLATCFALTFAPIAMASPFGTLFAGTRPPHVGVGALAPCPATPNCVLSTSRDAHAIAPLAFSGDAGLAWRRLEEIARSTPHATVIVNRPGYLYIEVASATFGFVDDVELVLNASASVIDVRSASRLGRSDFGVNRARIEAIRTAFEGQTPGRTRT